MTRDPEGGAEDALAVEPEESGSVDGETDEGGDGNSEVGDVGEEFGEHFGFLPLADDFTVEGS